MNTHRAKKVLELLKSQAKKYKNERVMAVLKTPGTNYERRIEAKCKNIRVTYFEQLTRVDSEFAISCIKESSMFEIYNITEGVKLEVGAQL